MKEIKKIERKIQKIYGLLDEIREELQLIENKLPQRSSKNYSSKPQPTADEMIKEYDNLYDQFIKSNSDRSVVENFVSKKKKDYLKAFCQANDLPVDLSRISKKKLVEVILQWLNQRKAITKKL